MGSWVRDPALDQAETISAGTSELLRDCGWLVTDLRNCH
jgi:hypothetical protein